MALPFREKSQDDGKCNVIEFERKNIIFIRINIFEYSWLFTLNTPDRNLACMLELRMLAGSVAITTTPAPSGNSLP